MGSTILPANGRIGKTVMGGHEAANNRREGLTRLEQLACEWGASRAATVATADIVVNDAFAALCRLPDCKVYGLSAGCPPHVGGPSEMRELLTQYERAIALKIDVPTDILLAEERFSIYRILHEIVAAVERAAVEKGFSEARAFAGGSCKRIFCDDHPDCSVLAGGACRRPDRARPSMSGYGIDVSRLMKAAGWQMSWITRNTSAEEVPMGALVGMVLID
jgi:predicted metal-binding protein